MNRLKMFLIYIETINIKISSLLKFWHHIFNSISHYISFVNFLISILSKIFPFHSYYLTIFHCKFKNILNLNCIVLLPSILLNKNPLHHYRKHNFLITHQNLLKYYHYFHNHHKF